MLKEELHVLLIISFIEISIFIKNNHEKTSQKKSDEILPTEYCIWFTVFVMFEKENCILVKRIVKTTTA